MFFDCTRAAFRKKIDEEKIGAKTQKRPQKEPENRESVHSSCQQIRPKKKRKEKKNLLYFLGGEFSPF
jgi:hypothetical protein